MQNIDSPRLDTAREKYFLIGVILYVLGIHSALFVYDYINEFAPFFLVDRANNRIDAIRNLLTAQSPSEFFTAIVTNNIIVGEYIVQAGLFRIGGPCVVILFQIFLQLASVCAVYRIARLTLNSPRLSFISAVIYATLPHSLAFPHQLASEALGTPLVIFVFWLMAEYLSENASWISLLAAGILCGAAACIRPVLMLLPAALAICVIAKRGRHGIRDAAVLIVTGAIAPLMILALFMAKAHQPSLGNTMSGMGYNLYLRVMRITSTSLAPADQRYVADRYFAGTMNEGCIGNPLDGASCTLSAADYASFVARYPSASAHYVVRDLVTFVAKSGVSSLTANYFNMANDEKIKDYKNGWHAVWDSQGLYAALLMVLHENPEATIIEVAASGVFVLLFICFITGCSDLVRSAMAGSLARNNAIVLCALALFPLYIFVTSEVSAFMLSRYRYPSEFAICIVGVLGASTIMRRFKRRPDARAAL